MYNITVEACFVIPTGKVSLYLLPARGKGGWPKLSSLWCESQRVLLYLSRVRKFSNIYFPIAFCLLINHCLYLFSASLLLIFTRHDHYPDDGRMQNLMWPSSTVIKPILGGGHSEVYLTGRAADWVPFIPAADVVQTQFP